MAHHDLQELQRMARDAPLIFLFDTRKSLRIVESYFGVAPGEARAIVLEIVTLLDATCFAHSLSNKVPLAALSPGRRGLQGSSFFAHSSASSSRSKSRKKLM